MTIRPLLELVSRAPPCCRHRRRTTSVVLGLALPGGLGRGLAAAALMQLWGGTCRRGRLINTRHGTEGGGEFAEVCSGLVGGPHGSSVWGRGAVDVHRSPGLLPARRGRPPLLTESSSTPGPEARDPAADSYDQGLPSQV